MKLDSTASDSAGDEGDATEPEADAPSSTDASADAADSTLADSGDGGPPPVVLVSDAPNASLLATDGTSVFWIDWLAGDAGQQNGRVMKVGVDGGSETTLASTPGVVPESLAMDGTNVYWTESDGKLWQVSKVGGTAQPLVASGVATPVAASGGSVYFCPSTGGGVQSVPVDGGTVITLAAAGQPVDLVVAGGSVYWADSSGHIATVSIADGGAPTVLVSSDAGPGEYVSNTAYQNLATDGTNLYWPRLPNGSYSGAVMSLPLGGGTPQVVLDIGTDSPQSVATDGTHVYFLDVAGTSSLVSLVPADDGGSPATITSADMGTANITGVPGPTIAVDSTSVYWLDPPQIVKVAK
jgi:hypothetical protein